MRYKRPSPTATSEEPRRKAGDCAGTSTQSNTKRVGEPPWAPLDGPGSPDTSTLSPCENKLTLLGASTEAAFLLTPSATAVFNKALPAFCLVSDQFVLLIGAKNFCQYHKLCNRAIRKRFSTQNCGSLAEENGGMKQEEEHRVEF